LLFSKVGHDLPRLASTDIHVSFRRFPGVVQGDFQEDFQGDFQGDF